MNQHIRHPQTQATDSLFARAARIYGCARMGMAASDTVLNIDLEKGGYQETFEAIAATADTLMSDLMEVEGTEFIAEKFERWKSEKARLKGKAATEGDDFIDSPEYDAKWSALETLGDEIALASPRSFADAAAMLDWSVLDSDNGSIMHPNYQQVQTSVAEFLRKAGVVT